MAIFLRIFGCSVRGISAWALVTASVLVLAASMLDWSRFEGVIARVAWLSGGVAGAAVFWHYWRREGRIRRFEREFGRVQRLTAGKCPTCEYDLTGLPEPRCPECGERFHMKPPSD